MNKIQEKILNVMIDIDRVCRENNIKYQISYGSLIGTIRHKGFIPWDDDMDIIMTRENYNKFLAIANDKLLPKYRLLTWDNTKDYPYNFAKVEDTETTWIENNALDTKFVIGAYVDIFPADKVKYNPKRTKRLYKWQGHFQTLAYMHYTKVGKNASKIRKIIQKFVFKKDATFWHNLIDKMITKSPKGYDSYVVFINCQDETIYKPEDFELIEKEFEGHKFYCSKNYDKLLTSMYGNYMKIPKEEDRETHNPVYINMQRRVSKEEIDSIISEYIKNRIS